MFMSGAAKRKKGGNGGGPAKGSGIKKLAGVLSEPTLAGRRDCDTFVDPLVCAGYISSARNRPWLDGGIATVRRATLQRPRISSALGTDPGWTEGLRLRHRLFDVHI